MPISISPSERVLLAGKSGAGKTTVARALLSGADRLIVVDSKFNLDPAHWHAEIQYALPDRLPRSFRIILRADELDAIGDRLIRESDFYLYIDELYAVFPSAAKMLPGWRALWTRGRESSIGVWAGVQRPASIPLVTMSEADHFFVFRLALREDRDRLSAIVGVEIPALQQHAFVYANPATDVYWQIGALKEIRR